MEFPLRGLCTEGPLRRIRCIMNFIYICISNEMRPLWYDYMGISVGVYENSTGVPEFYEIRLRIPFPKTMVCEDGFRRFV